MNEVVDKMKSALRDSESRRRVLFVAVLLLGIFARAWEFGRLPAGLNVDEASIGVDAYYVYKYGVDRNGVSYPTQFIAYGQEQNALYGYLLIPFIAALGLKVTVIRLPMLVLGILTLPLVYLVAKRTFGERLGLLSMFFVAISPWHIMLSRFALDVNLFPFIFTLGYAGLVRSLRNSQWFPVACFFFALCFYSYGPSYFIVPAFLAGALWMLIKKGQVNPRYAVAGLALLGVLAIPIGLFIIINAFGLDSIQVGPVTIPALPSPPRFLSETSLLHGSLLPTLGENLWRLLVLLFSQTDGLVYNAYEPYGYFYKVTFPFSVLGAVVLFQNQRLKFKTEESLLLLWLAVSLVFGILQPVNINRLNIIFIPLLICAAVSLDWLGRQTNLFFILAIGGLLIGFLSFTADYHGEAYKAVASRKFRSGLLSAIQYAGSISQGPICVTDELDHPYIYVLFVEKPDPATYLDSIEYENKPGPFRYVRSLLRYTFGKQNCPLQPLPVYVLAVGESPPQLGKKYELEFFDNYVVYYPKP